MEDKVLSVAARLIRAYKKHAEERALVDAKWRNKLNALEGELLAMADKEITSELTHSELKDLMK